MKSSIFLFLSLFIFYSCGSDSTASENESSDNRNSITIETDDGDGESVNINIDADNIEEAVNQLADAFREETGVENVDVMNFRDIKAVFPNRLFNIEKTDDNGETTKVFGFQMSQADAIYEEDDIKIEIQIVDAANMGIAKLSEMAWTNIEVDKESDDGYERTVDINGDKAYEKWDNRRERGELHVFYKDRYIVNIEIKGLEMDDLRTILRNIDLDDLD